MPTGSVKVTNLAKTEFRDFYSNDYYSVAPGRSAIVPYEAIQLWCGDPEAVDRDEHHHDRRDELNRLHVRYGALNPDNPDAWSLNAPQLKVESLDDSVITTVIDDPEGKGVTPASVTQKNQDFLQVQIEQQQRELEALKRELRAQREVDSLPPLDIPEDTPEVAASRPVVKKTKRDVPRVAEFDVGEDV